jgi:hypothetical protein
MNIELIIATGGAVATGLKWVYEYTEKRKWEKNKFLLEQVEKFQNLETTICAEKCLDWNSATITYGSRDIKFDDKVLFDALTTHDKKHKFNQDEVTIRKIFDNYFDNLTKLIILSKSKIISEKNLILFLEYWFDILSGDSHSKNRELVEQIHSYLNFYGYTHLYDFLIYNTQNK